MGAEYYLQFTDRSALIDKKYSLYRRGRRYNTTTVFTMPQREDETNLIATAEWKYPLDFFTSIGGHSYG